MSALEARAEASALDVAAASPYDRRREVVKAVPGARLIHRRRLVNDEGRELTPSELAMRRARRRRFKDEFIPRTTYDKHRDGYYFGTGARGTGYYLDETTIDYGDVDDEGYVLVRVAPPVALQRALPRRRSVGRQGLLFDEAFLDALGPAHGAPSDRYCVVAPPWLCGMPPPPSRFEKENSGGTKATFTNEMARERLAYLRRRHDDESRRRKLYSRPKTLTICSKNGAVVRLRKALDSAKIAVLEPGATCVADEEALDGVVLRCRITEPVRGWLSRKVVTCPDADFGTLVAPKEAVRRVPAGNQVQGRAASNRDLVAAEPKTQIAICEDDVVALPVACGEMAFRGDALEPVFTQKGPWAVRLELEGVHEKPLAFVATIKRKTLLKESRVLLELFAKTHAAKYDTDIGVLELYQGGRRIDEATLICELVEDLDATAPSISAAFVVKRRHGASEEAVVSARSLLLQKRAPVIDDWSSQKEILAANAAKGPGQQQTSAEIRAYWDEQKRSGYKHWRTDAALRGFYTRTEDEAKVKQWDASLKPKRGFLEGSSVYSDEVVAERRRRDASLGSSEGWLSSKRG
ncbi:unnamed protein product [Pelagomonas calceolata]|uniref:Uncharacterized protein n=1 Tax=Pelagomonas calceolata TaxID=35677 RepID=A0A8J2SBV0_9STRA|nr:unnamed protein product [Pelagomonas calceolata]